MGISKRMLLNMSSLLLTILFYGCSTIDKTPPKFQRVFSWNGYFDEERAKKFAEIGVTDLRVFNKKQYDLALKYGMDPYCGTFLPAGPHLQVLTKAEKEYFDYITGADLDRRKLGKAEFRKILDSRRREKKHRYGGEIENGGIDTIEISIPCFNSDKGYVLSKRKIDNILARAVPGVKGIYFDYLGYTNLHGCYCNVCLRDYQKFLKNSKLSDTAESRKIFYRDILVKYYNAMIDYVKSKRPDFRVLVHVYPVFMPDPLYANRTKSDWCGHTVAWYFSWPLKKVAAYTEAVIKNDKKYFRHAAGVPFVGLKASRGSSLAHKTPEVLEKELQTILAAGGRTLQVCSGNDMIKPGYFEVFKKYCGK